MKDMRDGVPTIHLYPSFLRCNSPALLCLRPNSHLELIPVVVKSEKIFRNGEPKQLTVVVVALQRLGSEKPVECWVICRMWCSSRMANEFSLRLRRRNRREDCVRTSQGSRRSLLQDREIDQPACRTLGTCWRRIDRCPSPICCGSPIYRSYVEEHP